MIQPDKDTIKKLCRNNKTSEILREVANIQFREYQIDMKQRNTLENLCRELEDCNA